MNVIRSIPTPYAGVLYRSALEADTAKTLRTLGIVAHSEPEGFKLPNGEHYLPDFYLPLSRCFLETKGIGVPRIHKPALLAGATLHAPGCDVGRPERTFERPPQVAPASCGCGFGPDFPFILVVVTRPAVPGTHRGLPPSTNGYFAFEPVPGMGDQVIALVDCPIRHRPFFMDANGIPVCRCCWQVLPAGTRARRSGEVPFQKVPRPAGKARKAVAATAR